MVVSATNSMKAGKREYTERLRGRAEGLDGGKKGLPFRLWRHESGTLPACCSLPDGPPGQLGPGPGFLLQLRLLEGLRRK